MPCPAALRAAHEPECLTFEIATAAYVVFFFIFHISGIRVSGTIFWVCLPTGPLIECYIQFVTTDVTRSDDTTSFYTNTNKEKARPFFSKMPLAFRLITQDPLHA